MESLLYRTDDNTRWGGGLGFDLSAVQIDQNFWKLFSAVQALEDHQDFAAGIDFITQPTNGNIFYIHLTDHRVLGPFTIPTSRWTPRGDWAATTPYALYDTVGNNGSLYLVITPHTSGSSFSPFATDGHGNLLYVLILEQPANMIPENGLPGQRLVKSTGSPFGTEFLYDLIRLSVYVAGPPEPGERLIQYPVVDAMTIEAGLTGSAFYQKTPTESNVSYTMLKNEAPIGTIDFTGPSPETITVSLSTDIDFVAGDVFALEAPVGPDAAQADISFTIVALLKL